MPNKRAANQTLIAFACDRELLRALDIARAKSGQNRSSFVREAIVNELHRLGITIPSGLASAPDRVKVDRYPQANSRVMEAALKAVQVAKSEVVRKRRRRPS